MCIGEVGMVNLHTNIENGEYTIVIKAKNRDDFERVVDAIFMVVRVAYDDKEYEEYGQT